MDISLRLSNKIKILSFCSIIAVVWMHSYYLESDKWASVHFVQKFVALFADFAVPLFFIISGFLFFANYREGSTTSFFLSKIRKRIRSLVLPYAIWCTLYIATIFIIGFFVDYNTDYFVYCKQGQWWEFLSYVYLKPAAFHLWFIRDLFMVILCSPLIFLFIKYLPIYVQIICLLSLGVFQFIPIISWGLLWFTIGSMFSLNKKEIFYFINPLIAILCLMAYSVTIACFVMLDISLASDRHYAALVILLGVAGIWKGSDCLCSFNSVNPMLHYTFFIYCSHIPLLNIVKTIIYPWLIDSYIGSILGFLLSPVVTISACLMIGKLLQSKAPTLYRVISGGRSYDSQARI